MRIAIVGAGMAGLACAHELERLGFAPEIFTAGGKIGKPGLTTETMAQFMHHNPTEDVFAYLREALMLPVHPSGVITSVTMYSAENQASFAGKLGYTTIRGQDERSLDYQLYRRIKAPVHFHSEPDVLELSEQYDWVVVATGTPEWPRRLGLWDNHLSWCARSAIVTGDFDPASLHFFFLTRYAKTGYAMLAPLDERTAAAGVGVPGASVQETEQYWETFRTEQGHLWEREEQQHRWRQLECGTVRSRVVGNILLVGVAGGFQEPLGITGQCSSLASGVMAARQIALQDRSLERFARQYQVLYDRTWRLRRYVNAWTDKEMNLMVRLGKARLSNWLATSTFNLLKPAAALLDPLRMPDDYSPEVGPL